MLCPTQGSTSEITPSLAALDDAQTLRRREWIRGEPGEDTPQQYSSISGHLTPMAPRHEDIRLDPSLHVTQKDLCVIYQLLSVQKKLGKEDTKCLRKKHRGPL